MNNRWSRHSRRTEPRKRSQIGNTQITKSGKLPTLGSGDDIANFDLVVGDDDAVNEQLNELTLLLKGGMVQAPLDALAKILQVGDTTGEFETTVSGGLKLLDL